MIKRTLYFGNPAYLSTKNEQLVIKKIENDEEQISTVPIEDIGIVILDHYGVTISQYLVSLLLENNVALITCNKNHHPTGLLLNLDGNSVQSEKFRAQIDISKPLCKQLWQQTISSKIYNQAMLLKKEGKNNLNMLKWSEKVRSGDSSNLEARASVYYWKNLFGEDIEFYRDRFGEPPNNLLNYGYAILRAIVARGLVASGLLPTLGIFHKNKYNAYCLADDIMEPYRPYIDNIVLQVIKEKLDYSFLTPELKKRFFNIPIIEILINKKRSPLIVGLQKTTNSLAQCFQGKGRKILFPIFS
ncbi:MAG: type II CRISPR-associated endonuclease Cas1 [Ignavibacteria bacterium]|nr:type II CRISPR-associated endonuclease Cas1 [Ignavibacteria bacterium]